MSPSIGNASSAASRSSGGLWVLVYLLHETDGEGSSQLVNSLFQIVMKNWVFPCEWYVISLQVWQTWSHFSKWHIEWPFFTWTCSKLLYKHWIMNLAEIITLMRAGAVKYFSQWMGCFPMNAALTFARMYVSLDVYLIWSSCFVEYFQT